MRKVLVRSGIVATVGVSVMALLAALGPSAQAYSTPYVSVLPSEGGFVRVLDIANSSTADRARAVLWALNSGDASQRWNIEYRYTRNGHGVYKLINGLSHKCLDKSQDTPNANGNAVYQYRCLNATNQEWEFIPGSGTYARWGQLKNIAGGRCLDIKGPSYTDGAVLHVWDCYSTWSQRWNIDP
jgi:Ricin-type beta-trefoil lectin domain-like